MVHFLGVLAVSLPVASGAALSVDRVRPLELLTLPLAFLAANLTEYFGHRFPMHRRMPGLFPVYRRHTREHHRFFTASQMGIDSPRDFKVVLFPPILLLFFLGCVGAPIAAILFFALGKNVAALFVLVAVSYYALYECLHLAYHLPASSRVGAMVRPLREHHRLHHHPAFMRTKNLNITFPIGDLVFGTALSRAEAQAFEAESARAKGESPASDRAEARA